MKRMSNEDSNSQEVLKSISMFNDLKPEDLDALKIISENHVFEAGECLVRKGSQSEAFYVILEGEAAVYVDEAQEPIAILGKGEMVGELGILNDEPRNATVKALSNVKVVGFDGKAFVALMKEHNAIVMAVVHALSRRLSGMLK